MYNICILKYANFPHTLVQTGVDHIIISLKIYIFSLESLPFISEGGISVLSSVVVVSGTVDVLLGAKEVEVSILSVA